MLSEHDLETATERELWTAITRGAAVDAIDKAEDQRVVRAQLLEELLTTEGRPGDGRARALRLRGARITGTLDLSGLNVVCGVLIVDSDFDEPLLLDAAQLPSLTVDACRLPALNARQIETRGNLYLGNTEASAVT